MNYKSDLKKILKFWIDSSIDYENGGIFTCVDREGNIYNLYSSPALRKNKTHSFTGFFSMRLSASE